MAELLCTHCGAKFIHGLTYEEVFHQMLPWSFPIQILVKSIF